MLSTTLGQVLLNDALPPDLRDWNRVLDKKGSSKLFQEIAEKYPDKYKEISKRFSDIGKESATESGGYSVGVSHLQVPESIKRLKDKIQTEIFKIVATKEPDAKKQQQIISLLQSKSKELETTLFDEVSKTKNPLAMQVISGARGNPGNIRSILGGDFLYEDARGNPVPIPVFKSYSQGLSPAEFWAGSYGARKGIIDLKAATADAGYLGKQLVQAAHRLVVTAKDSDTPPLTTRGYPVDTVDNDNEGALLAKDIGPYKRNQILTPKILADLNSKGFKKILVRSPMVGGPPDGGVYGRDVGVRERGGLAPVGDFVGIAAAHSTSEPLTQAQISSKHSGGVAGASAIGGFKYINQLVQVPKVFPGGATHSQLDGKVSTIYDAPTGGKYIMINSTRHYVPPNLNINVKPGDLVEAGDTLTEGLPNPSEIVAHKGIGEGRRYFVDVLRKMLKDSGIKSHRRNLELISRGLINHVSLSEELGDFIPGDIVPYDVLEHQYKPRQGHAIVPIKQAVGKYLEVPVLHYSIGTKLQHSMLHDLDHFGVKNVIVHNDPPPFEPLMIRAMETISHDPDWQTKQLGSALEKNVLRSAHRGAVSDQTGTSYVPSLARAVDFGRVGKTKSFDPKTIEKVI